MKTFTSILFLFVFGFLSGQSDSCNIQFFVEGLHGGKVKLISVYGEQNFIADSTMMDSSGYFNFKRKSPLKPGYYYLILPDYSNIHMLLDADQHFSMHTNRSDLNGAMKIEASIDNQLLYESFKVQSKQEALADSLTKIKKEHSQDTALMARVDERIKQMQTENKELLKYWQKNYPKAFFTKFKTAGQNPDVSHIKNAKGEPDIPKQIQRFRESLWDDVDLSDIRMLYTPVMINKLKRFMIDLTVQQPDSIIRQADIIIKKSMVNKEMFQFVSNWIALKYQPTKTKVMDGEAVFVHVLENYFTKELAFWMDEKELEGCKKKINELKSSLLNKKGLDVVSTDIMGKQRSMFEIKEDFIILFIYDPDCEHCQKETPLLREFYKKWKAKSVEVFAAVINSTDQEWRDFVKKNQIESWINVHDPTNRSIYAKYNVDITPEIYVLNKERIIIGKNLNVEQLPYIIEKDLENRKK